MIAITHPIKQLINSQYDFLSSMLDRFPSLLGEWIHKQEKEVEKQANEIAEGDSEVYWSTYANEISRVDPCYEEEQLFNHAMMIMVYSYYESTLLRLVKEINEKEERPSVIAKHFGVVLDDELLKISNYLFNTVLPLRNQLCHNNQGTLFARSKKEDVENIDKLEERNFITIQDGKITNVNRDFIKKVLYGEHELLLKLAEICGFKTRFFRHKDGKMLEYDNSYKMHEDFLKDTLKDNIMLLLERQKTVIERLIESGQMNVQENVIENIIETPTTLAAYFDVSERTIRRDIAKLKDFGILTRAYDQKVWKWVIKIITNQWL